MVAKTDFGAKVEQLQVHNDYDPLRSMLEVIAREIMAEEVEAHLGAQRHERTCERKGYRNGTKERSWKTRVGELRLDVPQVRDTEPYHPSFFARWERCEQALLATCSEMYFKGISTRKVADVLEQMGGFRLSATTVSRVAQNLDEQISEFRSRPLNDCLWPYLVVDARYEKVRKNKRIVSQAVLIVAGVNEFGQRQVLSWAIGDSEAESTWRDLFRDLKRRGLHGVELLVSDAHKGIRAAADRELNDVMWQRCYVHFMRELSNKVSYKVRKEINRDLRSIFMHDERDLCLQTASEVADKWRSKKPQIARILEEETEQCLAVLELPESHRRRLRSTNMLERMMRELKRRTRVIGIFPNVASLDRMVGAQLLDIDDKWQCEQSRYLVFDRD